MWSGLHSGLIYTIRQSGGAKFYITRATERSHFASTRSLALAKATAQDDANDMLKAKDRTLQHELALSCPTPPPHELECRRSLTLDEPMCRSRS